jgi:hypothetical protein
VRKQQESSGGAGGRLSALKPSTLGALDGGPEPRQEPTAVDAGASRAGFLAQELRDFLGRAAEDGPVAALDDGALDEVWVLGHVADEFVVGEFAPAEVQFAVDGLARPQKLARRDAHLPDQFAQLLLADGLDVVVDPLEIDAALTEQAGGLAALRSSRLLVDGDFVRHVSTPGKDSAGARGLGDGLR